MPYEDRDLRGPPHIYIRERKRKHYFGSEVSPIHNMSKETTAVCISQFFGAICPHCGIQYSQNEHCRYLGNVPRFSTVKISYSLAGREKNSLTRRR